MVSGVSLAVTLAVSDNHPTLLPFLILPPVSFAGQGFLAFYLAGKLHLFDRRGHAVSCSLLFTRPGSSLTSLRITAESVDFSLSA